MKKINYKSDIAFTLHPHDCTGKAVPLTDCDWQMRLWTAIKANAITVSRKDGVCSGCSIAEDGSVRIYLDNHGLSPGRLVGEIVLDLPDENFADGYRRIVAPFEPDIELVTYSCVPTFAEASLILPYVKGDKGEDGITPDIAPIEARANEAAASAQAAQAAVRNSIKTIEPKIEQLEAGIADVNACIAEIGKFFDNPLKYIGKQIEPTIDIQLSYDSEDIAVFLSRPLEEDEHIHLMTCGNKKLRRTIIRPTPKSCFKWHVMQTPLHIFGNDLYASDVNTEIAIDYKYSAWVRYPNVSPNYSAERLLKDVFEIYADGDNGFIQRKSSGSKWYPIGRNPIGNGCTYGIAVYKFVGPHGNPSALQRQSKVKYFRVVGSSVSDDNEVTCEYMVL